MSQSPMLWGAGLACALGGAIAGTMLGSSPLIAAGTSAVYYQDHSSDDELKDPEERLLPDHYPLVTRQGTVPVTQLSDRGLFSQARYRAIFTPTDPTGGYARADLPEHEPRFERADRSADLGEAPAPSHLASGTTVVSDASPPLPLANGPATLPAANGGSAKMVNVSAVLAMR